MDCLVCRHPEREHLLAALPHTPLRTLAAQYHISKSVLGRHRRGCPDVPQCPRRGVPQDEPPAPVRPRNPLAVYHGEAQQLYAALNDYTTPIEARGALTALCALLVKLTADGGDR